MPAKSLVRNAMCNDRTKTFDFNMLSSLFNKFNGYYDAVNEQLFGTLVHWDLIDEKNRNDEAIVYGFMKWSFTVSFLKLINSFQWFLAGVLLERTAVFPAQVMQMYYYSIFFSYGSFLSGQGKGHYTIKEETNASGEIIPTRREVWLELENPPFLCIKEKGRGGEHEIRANWFYEVFRNWEFRDSYPTVLLFESDRRFHTGFRNMFTYSLADMAEELFEAPDPRSNMPSNEILLDLWNHSDEALIDYFPDEYWALEHIKPSLDFHVKLLDGFESESPLKGAQTRIVEGLLSHHEKTGLLDFLQVALQPILSHIDNAG